MYISMRSYLYVICIHIYIPDTTHNINTETIYFNNNMRASQNDDGEEKKDVEMGDLSQIKLENSIVGDTSVKTPMEPKMKRKSIISFGRAYTPKHLGGARTRCALTSLPQRS